MSESRTQLERLCKLAQSGDLDAANELLTVASRAGDEELAFETARQLFDLGAWWKAFLWYERRVQLLTPDIVWGYNSCTGKLQDDTPRPPLNCHELINAIGKILKPDKAACKDCINMCMRRGDGCPLCGTGDLAGWRVRRTWFAALKLWHPVGWQIWLEMKVKAHIAPDATSESLIAGKQGDALSCRLPIVPECCCVGADVNRGNCPECDGGRLWSGRTILEYRVALCRSCHGSKRCLRCASIPGVDAFIRGGQLLSDGGQGAL